MTEEESKEPLLRSDGTHDDVRDENAMKASNVPNVDCCTYHPKLRTLLFITLFVLTFVLIIGVTITLISLSVSKSNKVKPQTPTKYQFPYHSSLLPDHIKPHSYHLLLNHNLDKFTTQGINNITISCTKQTDYIVFHKKEMLIQSVRIYKSQYSNGNITITNKMFNPEYSMYYIKLSQHLQTNVNYTLSIKFQSHIFTDRLIGFYRSHYTNANGQASYLYVTQFEPIDARTALPCFDEPQLKVKVSLTVIRPKAYNVLSNMPKITERSIDNDLAQAEFAPTPPMSTYLIAYFLSDFPYSNITASNGLEIRAWAQPKKLNYTKEALQYAKQVLQLYTKMLQLQFPLPKLDMVGIPNYLSGGMENWGMITFPEQNLLYNPVTRNEGRKYTIFVTVAHEIAHQWFGNIVTMRWWNELWLNEGFATVMEFVSGYHLKSQKMMMTDFYEKMMVTLIEDGFYNSHQLSAPINNPVQINEIFDVIEYLKGGAILRMAMNLVGEKNFFLGVSQYLNRFKYKNSQSKDLWRALDTVSQYNMTQLMTPWIYQCGYPLVTVNIDRNNYTANFTVSKFTNYHYSSDQTRNRPANTFWPVPFTYYIDEEQHTKVITKSPTIIELPQSFRWFKGNVYGIGFFRVNYDKQTWQELVEILTSRSENLTALDKAVLLNDAFNLVSVGQLEVEIFLNLTEYIIHERSEMNRVFVHSKLNFFKNILQDNIDKINIMKYIRYLKYTIENHNNSALVKEDLRQFHNWLYHHKSIAKDKIAVVLRTGVRAGSDADWMMLLNKYIISERTWIRSVMGNALSSTMKGKLIQKLLHTAIHNKNITNNDLKEFVFAISYTEKHKMILWNFVTTHWDLITKRFIHQTSSMSRIIERITIHFDTQSELNMIVDFFKTHHIKYYQSSVWKAIDKVAGKVNWRKAYAHRISQWLKKMAPKIDTSKEIIVFDDLIDEE